MASTRLRSGDIVEIISLKHTSNPIPPYFGPLSGVKIGDQVKVDTYDSNDETWSIYTIKATRAGGSFVGWIPRKNIRPSWIPRKKIRTVRPVKLTKTTTAKFAVDEAFIKAAHKDACSEWKKKLETKFPTILKKQAEYLKIPTKITLDAGNDIWIGDGCAPTGKEQKCIMSSTYQPIVSNVYGYWMVEFKKIVK